MYKPSFTVTEKNSSIVFAAIKDVSTNEILKEKTALAVKEEFCYETVTPHQDIVNNGDIVHVSFDCITEDGEEEVRDIELQLTAIY